jgi:hypothetical protein
MRGVAVIKKLFTRIYLTNYKSIYKRIGVTLLVHKGNEAYVNLLIIIDLSFKFYSLFLYNSLTIPFNINNLLNTRLQIRYYCPYLTIRQVFTSWY